MQNRKLLKKKMDAKCTTKLIRSLMFLAMVGFIFA